MRWCGLLALLALGSAAADHPSCARLADKHRDRMKKFGERYVSVNGQLVGVTLYWGSDPARAAATLLRVLLRDVLHYQRVRTAQGPHDITALATNVTFDPSARYTDLVIGVAVAWEPHKARTWTPHAGESAGLAGPRLRELGASPVAARRRLHEWRPCACRPALGDDAALRARCGCGERGNVSAEVLGVGDCDVTLQELSERARAAALPLRMRRVSRAELLRTLRAGNHSFLFLDYDIWQGEPGVSIVEPPPCVSTGSVCQQELDSAISMRVADVDILQTYAPELLEFIHNHFEPSPESLRLILEQEANGKDIEEAVCEWASEQKYVIERSIFSKYDRSKYYVPIYLSEDDPDRESYDDIVRIISRQFMPQTSESGYVIGFPRYFINCSDAHNMSMRLDEHTKFVGFRKTLGVVSQTVEGAAAAAATAHAHRVPLLLVGVAPEREGGAPAGTWRAAARPRHVARALQHFVRESRWTRLAVLSQRTPLAHTYYTELQEDAPFLVRDYPIPPNLTEPQAKQVLGTLADTNARIVFVNAESLAALVLLRAALECRMSSADGYVWIVRDWRPSNATTNTSHFTVSPWGRREESLPPAAGLPDVRAALRAHWAGRPWPPLAVSLADALLTLIASFGDVFRRHPDKRYDLHTAHMIRSLNESISETPIRGVNQFLRYKDGSIEETFVYVDEWRGDVFTRLATWRVNATSGAVRGNDSERAVYVRAGALPSDDGAFHCVALGGDAFDPTCYDAAWICALLLLALIPVALLLCRRVWRRRLARLQTEQKLEVIARRRHVASVLASWLVERDALELHHELGAGRFGSVRLAMLRAPSHVPRYIAAKALRDNAAPTEESEFLREACIIASLDHAHIVRLVGVCIADGPPLVLMELAFFGDLLGYLRARRHLAEGAGSEALTGMEEAAHVSAAALTRLACEAAEALAYLSSRGVVHRDVRAANCLVDARRSLKLADFGMARATEASADGVPEYACRRRGLFPVLWMAPESLAHGVFSAASDVWALGVLVLELVTLGARPFGSMSPLRVLEHVAGGGCAPLPPDATPQTRGLARLCWQRAAERRPSAAEVAAYLRARPLALAPALLEERDEPADADSGFGESPSTELLPPETPLHSFDQLEVLAATH